MTLITPEVFAFLYREMHGIEKPRIKKEKIKTAEQLNREHREFDKKIK